MSTSREEEGRRINYITSMKKKITMITSPFTIFVKEKKEKSLRIVEMDS